MLICMSILIYILKFHVQSPNWPNVLLFGRVGVHMKLVVIIIYHGIYLVCAISHIDHILTSHNFRPSWKHFARWRDLRKDLHMKTDKELENVLGICAVQFHLVLSMKRYITSCIVIWRDVIWRHFKWRQRWAIIYQADSLKNKEYRCHFVTWYSGYKQDKTK